MVMKDMISTTDASCKGEEELHHHGVFLSETMHIHRFSFRIPSDNVEDSHSSTQYPLPTA